MNLTKNLIHHQQNNCFSAAAIFLRINAPNLFGGVSKTAYAPRVPHQLYSTLFVAPSPATAKTWKKLLAVNGQSPHLMNRRWLMTISGTKATVLQEKYECNLRVGSVRVFPSLIIHQRPLHTDEILIFCDAFWIVETMGARKSPMTRLNFSNDYFTLSFVDDNCFSHENQKSRNMRRKKRESLFPRGARPACTKSHTHSWWI